MGVCVTKETTSQQTFDHYENERLLVARDDKIQFPEFLHEDRLPFTTDTGAAAKKDGGTKEEETPLSSENKNNEEVDKTPKTNKKPEKEETKPDKDDGEMEKNELNDGVCETKSGIDAVEHENDKVKHEMDKFNSNIDEQNSEEKGSKEWEFIETSAIKEEEIHEIPKKQEEVIIDIDMVTAVDVNHARKNIIEENLAEEVHVAKRNESEDEKKLEITYQKSLEVIKILESLESAESEPGKVDVNQPSKHSSKVEANNAMLSKTTAATVSTVEEPEKIVYESPVATSNDIIEPSLNNSKWVPETTTSVMDFDKLVSDTNEVPKNDSIQSTDNIELTKDRSKLSNEFIKPNSGEIEPFINLSDPTLKHQTDILETSTDLSVTTNNAGNKTKSVEISCQRNPTPHQTENIALHDLKAEPVIIKLINEKDEEETISQSDTPSNSEPYYVSKDPSQLEKDISETKILKDENLILALDKTTDACDGEGKETEEKGDTSKDSEIAAKESAVCTGNHKESQEGVNEQSQEKTHDIEDIKQEDGVETEIKMIEIDDAIEEVEKPGHFYLDDHSSKDSLTETEEYAITKVDESEEKGDVCKIIPQNTEEAIHDTKENQYLEVKTLEKEKEREEKGIEEYVRIFEDEKSSREEEFENKKCELVTDSEKGNQQIETTHKPKHDRAVEKKSLELNEKEESKTIEKEKFVEIAPDAEEIMITELPVLQAQKVDIEIVTDLTLLENNSTAGDDDHTLDENVTETNEDSTEKHGSDIRLPDDERSQVQSETQGNEDVLKRNEVESISTETKLQKNETDNSALKDVISKEEHEANFVENKNGAIEKDDIENPTINGEEEGKSVLPSSIDLQNQVKGEGIPSKLTEETHVDVGEIERKRILSNEKKIKPSDKQENVKEENLANEQKSVISNEILEPNPSGSLETEAEKMYENGKKMLQEERKEHKPDELLFDEKIEDDVNEHKSDTESKSEGEEKLSEKQEHVLEVDTEDVEGTGADPNESGNTEDTEDLQGDLAFLQTPYPLPIRFDKASTFDLEVGRSVTVATPGHYVPEIFFADTVVQGGTFQIPCGRAIIEKRKLTAELFKEITENRQYSATPAEEPQNEQNKKEVTKSKMKPSKEIIITDKVDRSVQYSDNEENDEVTEDKMKKLPDDLTPKQEQVLENRNCEEDITENVAKLKIQLENGKLHENAIAEPLVPMITEKSFETNDGKVDTGDIDKEGEDSVGPEEKEKPREIDYIEQLPETPIEETYEKPIVSTGSWEKEEPEKNILQLKPAKNEDCKGNIVEILKETEKKLEHPVAEAYGEGSGENTPEEVQLDDYDLIDAVSKEQQPKTQSQDYIVPVMKDGTDVIYTDHELTSNNDNIINDIEIESSGPDKSDLQNEVRLCTKSVINNIFESV